MVRVITGNKAIKAVIVFYACAFAFIYGTNFLLPQFSALSLSERLIWPIVSFSVLFTLVVTFTKVFIGKWKPKRVGWTKENFSRSFLWVSALLSPVVVGNLISCHVEGTDHLMEQANTGISAPYPSWLPLFGIAFWSLSGASSFSFLQAFPCDCLWEHPKKYVLPVIAILFILWYNAPLLTGAFKVDDIVFLGIIFLALYYKFRNSFSLILAYVALYENPILWCFGAAWGNTAILTVIYARAVWCGIAVLALIVRGRVAGLRSAKLS